MALTIDQYADLVATTLSDLDKGVATDIASDLTDYPAATQLLQDKRVKFQGGKTISVNVMYDEGTAAAWTGLYEEDDVDVSDGHTSGTIPWRHLTAGYAYDVREPEINGDEYQIYDIIKSKRERAKLATIVKLETQFWGKPSSSSDTTLPYGIDMYAVASASAAGFNGGNPSGFTSGVVLDSSTYTAWKNYTFTYTTVNRDDFISKLKKQAYSTNFKSPINMGRSDKNKRAYYTTWNVRLALEKYLEDQNDNLGNDTDSKANKSVFQGNPVVAVPYLDSNPTQTDIFYQVDWSTFYPVYMRGHYGRKTGPSVKAGQHNVLECFEDWTMNYACFNRRKLGVAYAV